jgi:hypothetical protein
MTETDTPQTPTYLWYQIGSWTDLAQGDLLPNCPVLVPPGDLTNVLLNVESGDRLDIPSQIQFADLIIVSQSCDLLLDKITQVLLCGHFPASSVGREQRVSIRKEQRPALHMIERCELSGHEFERQIIDFRTIYTLPKDFVTAFAASLGSRVRLLSPYKEHLSQAFARYFMRVGLPRPLEDD